MADTGSLLRVEEGQDQPSEAEASHGEGEEPHSLSGERLAWRLAVAGVAVLALMGALSMSTLLRSPPRRALVHLDAREVEQKFYDGSGAYWQAPGKGISTSELWGSCEHPHMHVCNGYCCCDKDFYWTSPKTMYQQGSTIIKKAAVGAAVKESHGLSATAAEEAVQSAAKALGKAALTSMVSADQKCVPRAAVPKEVVEALEDSGMIPGSDEWMACSASTSNSHTCGSHCCCNGGFRWSTPDVACISK